MYKNGEYVQKDESTAQQYYKRALSGFLKIENDEQADDNLFYKIGMMYKNGLGTDVDIEKAIEYFKRSAEMNNKNGLYEYGKALLLGEFIQQDTVKAVKLLENAIAFENKNAKRFFAFEYILGEHFEQNVEKGLAMLAECADSGDKFACYKLGKIYLSGELVEQDFDKAEKYLLLSDDNEFAHYALGKLYLQEEKYDIDKAVEYFEKSAEKNNRASFQLGRIYLFGANGLEKDMEKAIEWLTQSVEDGNEYAQNMLNHIDDFENAVLANTVLGLFVNLSKCIEEDYNQKFKSGRASVDRRLRKMIWEKKKALGIKEEHGIALSRNLCKPPK
jgi:hypothetical protein